MANRVTIEAEQRQRGGKGAARATRRAGKVPGVVYGASRPPELIALDPRVVLREIHHSGWRSRIYDLTLAGTATRALLRDVQVHPLTDLPEHVDFQRLTAGQPIRVAVDVLFTNEVASPGLKRGGVLNIVRHSVDVYCDPEKVPDHFEADLGGLDINDTVRWSSLKNTEGTRPIIADRDFVVASVAPPTKMAEVTAEAPVAATAAATPAGAAKPATAAKPTASAKPAASAKKE
ncbi:MAG TPA: 50S ribosomal protein L25/general stress protein Ctc [Acetobacteraceae bacterium]|nr:50S ribosomal protein L25/general stress protein Ctc [Acetobacteraceae bacterium]